jgi:hypothetical protein
MRIKLEGFDLIGWPCRFYGKSGLRNLSDLGATGLSAGELILTDGWMFF